MFFETDQVNDILICEQCKGRLDLAKILPCGKTICSFCAPLNLLSNTADNKFDCLVCKNKHEVPRDGLPSNDIALKILSVKLMRVSRGTAFDSLKKLLDEIQKNHSLLKLGIDNSSDLVNEYCLELKSEVQLAAEEIILQVEDLSTKIIEEINEYEKELIEFNKNNSKSLDEFNKIAKELESFYAVNNEYLKQYVVDDEILLKSKAEASCLITKAKMKIDNLKTVIFDGRFLMFEKNNEKIKRSILGTSKVLNTTTINSVILVELEKFRNLMSLCEFPIDQKLSLIYRASRDGFEGSSFHSKCDNIPNTLTIIKSTNGNVFGGFTEQSWHYVNWYKHDPSSFIFSLINIHNKPIKIKWSKNQSICCYSDYGPSFGAYDFYIAHKSNTNRESYSNLGDSFTHPEYAFGSEEAKSFLAGSYNFQVSEIEVYTKQ